MQVHAGILFKFGFMCHFLLNCHLHLALPPLKVVVVLKVLCYIDVGESNQATDEGGQGG